MPTLYSTDRIMTTHAGSLPRPADLRAQVMAKSRGEAIDQDALDTQLKAAVAEIVQQQVKCGLDSVNDGEISKSSFNDYVRLRIAGYETRPAPDQRRLEITARDRIRFTDYFEATGNRRARSPSDRPTRPVCIQKLRYIGQADLQQDLTNLKGALAGVSVAEAYVSAITPGVIEHWMENEHYKSEEEFLFAIADILREEYQGIIDAGFQLQIDDPDLASGWNCLPQMSLAEYRNYAAMRVEIMNHALKGIPRDSVRAHICWGAYHGPHYDDIPLKEIADIIFRINAGSFSIEASNPCHEHEWAVFEEISLPEGATFVPGVVGHYSDFIEHPDLIAQRIIRYAKLLGRENVVAGTDCGLGQRVGHPAVCWAKFEAMAEGARRATNILWQRPRKS